MDKHTIAMPGKLFDALTGSDAFRGSGESDQKALVAMQFATREKATRGVRYVVLASPQTLGYILEHLRGIKASQHGVSARVLERVAGQEIEVVKGEATPPEGKPVYHTRTKELVGYLTPTAFIPA